jgi:hypothetical protein
MDASSVFSARAAPAAVSFHASGIFENPAFLSEGFSEIPENRLFKIDII